MSSRPIEVEKLPIDTLVKLPPDPTMELVSSLVVMKTSLSLRVPDVYDPLQIFLQETRSHVISLFMVQSAIRSVFIMDNSHMSANCALL